jgi:hypothetical protein
LAAYALSLGALALVWRYSRRKLERWQPGDE